MFFSVIVPIFNRRHMIDGTLDSVDAQTFSDFELILVDDGSTDGTADYLGSRGFQVIRQENSGPGSARNTGVLQAKGEYLAFLDSDDRWFPWTLQLYADVICEHEEPAFITGSPQVVNTYGEQSDQERGGQTIECFRDYFSASDRWRWFGASSFVIRRDKFIELGGFERGRINGEDADLAMRLGTAEGFVHVAKPATFIYLNHEGNVTLDVQKSELGLKLLIEGERDGRFPGGWKRARERQQIIGRHIRPFVLERARLGDVRRATRYYRSIFIWCLRDCRLRFLLAAPVLCLIGLMRSARTKRPSGIIDS